MITIAHRLNTIIKSDRVLVLSFGEVLEYDTPKALMANPDSEFSMLLQEMQKEESE
jgi:ABC-type multidrug transport system fused ATPase/permease subunit